MRLLFVLALALAPALAPAQIVESSPVPRQPYIRASATARVDAKPDQLRIDIGVVTRAASASQAGADNARQFSVVLAELKRVPGEKVDVQTTSFGITPEYKYPKEGGTPTVVGYVATNVVRVTSNDVDNAGKLIDAASRSGANSIRAINWSLRDEQAVRAKALAEASKAARANAEAMAAGIGLKVVRVLRVEDMSQGDVRPVMERGVMMAARAMSEAVPTPVEAGTIQVSATVVLTVELAN